MNQQPSLLAPEETPSDVIDSLDGRIRVFLNRWTWRTDDRSVIERELREVIAYARRQG